MIETKSVSELLDGLSADDVAAAFGLADAWALCNIADGSVKVRLFAEPMVCWLDSAPMLDPRRHAPEVLAMNGECLAWAERRELICRHRRHRRLVRVLLAHEVRVRAPAAGVAANDAAEAKPPPAAAAPDSEGGEP